MPADLLAALDGRCSLDQVLPLDEGFTRAVLSANIKHNPLEASFPLLRFVVGKKIKLNVVSLEVAGHYAEAADKEPVVNLSVKGRQYCGLKLPYA